MNIHRAVEYLGSHGYVCSASTVRNLVRAGKLRCYRPGVSGKGRMEFAAERLDEFLRRAEWGGEGESKPEPGTEKPKRAASRPKPKPKADEAKAVDWDERYRKAVQS